MRQWTFYSLVKGLLRRDASALKLIRKDSRDTAETNRYPGKEASTWVPVVRGAAIVSLEEVKQSGRLSGDGPYLPWVVWKMRSRILTDESGRGSG